MNLDDHPISPRIKLSTLWATLMSLYIYNDYFTLFVPGTIDAMATGDMAFLGQYSDPKMMGVAMFLIVPACMVSLSSILSPTSSRNTNLVIGAIFLVIAALTLIGSPYFFKLVVCFEIAALIAILRIAKTWPKEEISSKIQ